MCLLRTQVTILETRPQKPKRLEPLGAPDMFTSVPACTIRVEVKGVPSPGSQSVPTAAVFAGHVSDPVPVLTDLLVDFRQKNVSGQSRAASVTLSRRSSCPCPHRLSGHGPPLDSAGIPFPLDGAATTPVSGRRETSEITNKWPGVGWRGGRKCVDSI